MKPTAIIWFDRLFLASLVVSTVDAVQQWPIAMAEMEADPFVAEHGLAVPLGLAAFGFGFGLSLLLWYLVSIKASRVAKWVLVLLAVLSGASIATLIAIVGFDSTLWAGAATSVVQFVAVATLFLPGAADWFRPNQISPATFE